MGNNLAPHHDLNRNPFFDSFPVWKILRYRSFKNDGNERFEIQYKIVWYLEDDKVELELVGSSWEGATYGRAFWLTLPALPNKIILSHDDIQNPKSIGEMIIANMWVIPVTKARVDSLSKDKKINQREKHKELQQQTKDLIERVMLWLHRIP